MKSFRWLYVLLVLLLTGGYSPAVADWVQIDAPLEITQLEEFTLDSDGLFYEVEVTITNTSTDTDIEGNLRLLFNPNVDPFPVPENALLAGEDGSNPTSYFDIATLQEDLLEAGEIAYVDMQFNADSIDALTQEQRDSFFASYALTLEVNDESILAEIFRKKISKTPEFFSGEASIEVMEVYVKAQSTQGQSYIRDAAGELVVCCADGEISEECTSCADIEETGFAMVKPLLVTYLQEEADVPFNNVPCYDPNEDGVADEGLRYAHDVYSAVSLDDGLTWKRKNISRTSTKSSFTLDSFTCNAEPLEYPGDSSSIDFVVAGHYALVTWADKYCRSGNPWDLADDTDIFQVTGSQKSVDYLEVKGDEEPRPDLGVRPFSCLWAARGVLELDPESPDHGTVVWYKAEQLTVGRRDAIRNFSAGITPLYDDSAAPLEGTGGFALTWQEDIKGLKTGKGRGPGAGMSGACVNHKTDVWYSHIDWASFAAIDPDFVPSEGGDDADPSGDSDGNTEYYCPTCPYVYSPEIGDIDNGIDPGTKFVDLPDASEDLVGWVCPLDGTPKEEFIKDAKPHALHTMSPPVPITDNAVCRDRIPEEVLGHEHNPALVSDCDYYYEGGTNNQPLYWDELPDDWECPQCGALKSTFLEDATFIKYRNEGGPYCEQFANNPRVDQDGLYTIPNTNASAVAYYTQDGEWLNADGSPTGLSDPGAASINEEGIAEINNTQVYWSGEPLDGNTGASRPNLSLVNVADQTLALIAYEETKGVGTGSDKQAAAMEQKAPFPLKLVDAAEDTYEGGFTNADCRSCHYENVVPRDRLIPMATEAECAAKGGIWDDTIQAFFPYTGYPLVSDGPVTLPDGVSTINPASGSERPVKCIKYLEGKVMIPRDLPMPPDGYNDLPDHMPGWHQAALDCTGCHLPYNTKDLDVDGVPDRSDKCLETPEGEAVVVDSTSSAYGCSDSQDPEAADNNKDEPDRFRHGKNVYYHHFAFNAPEFEAISHGAQINLENKFGWSEQGDIYENARRVRVVPNEAYDPSNPESVSLGLLYKEGKDGQGAPADAILRLFRGGFDAEKIGPPLNMSSSTPVWFQDPLLAGNEDGSGDNRAGDGSGDLLGNHKTPHIEYHYWTDENLNDPTGFWLKDDSGARLWEEDNYSPELRANPFENVFSTRLAIHGDTVVAGFAHCVNWSAGKKAKDHYDFYIRMSKDAGKTWTLPVNVSQLKNHEESVSDCRVILTPDTIDQEYPAEPGEPADMSMNGAPEVFDSGDFNNPNVLFVAVGTKENIPQPNPSDEETEENEVFLDVFYSKATIEGSLGGESGDLALAFDTFSKENPKYVEGSLPYLDPYGMQTNDAKNGDGIPNAPNPAFAEYVEEFDWLAKGDANQGDVQFSSNPLGTRIYTIWEQELPFDLDEDGQKHFQGSDVWFRKISYPDPEAAPDGDVDGDGDTDWDDGSLIKRSIGTTAYDPDFLWSADYISDFRITGHDYNRWKVQFTKDMLKKKRRQWRSK